MEEKFKKIDDTWKEAVRKEKEEFGKRSDVNFREADFSFFITTLGMQATIALGDVPNPVTKKQEKDLNQARFLIDTLNVLKEKTKGNLTGEEAQLLDNLLYGLRMSYIERSK